MKRVLFVSVWSRKNARFGMPASSWAYAAPPPVLSASLGSPQSNFGRITSPSAGHGRQRSSSSASKKQAAAVAPASAAAAAPTLAKRAIARTDSTGSLKRAGRPGHIRTASGSPAPSSLSPFPHASPRAVRTDPMDNIVVVDGRRHINSLDAALLSASAPAAANTGVGATTKVSRATPTAMRSKRSSDTSSSSFDQKRVKKQAA